MKRLCIVLFSLACASALGWGLVGRTGTVATGGASCDTNQQGELGASDGTYQTFNSVSYHATQFQASNTYTVCSVDVYLQASGSPTMNVTASIWRDDGLGGTLDNPLTQIGDASTPVSMSGLAASETKVTFTGISATVTNGTLYWLVLHADATSGSDYILWHYDSSGAVEDIERDADGAGDWTGTSSFNTQRYSIYSQ